jgi:malate synthase
MTTTQPTSIDRPALETAGTVNPSHARVLTPQALGLVAGLARTFAPRIQDLQDARAERRRRLAAGELRLDFPASTAVLRAAAWRVAPLPADLERRTVEITGPVDVKMIINALNSGADVFMADFEDANAPTWENQIAGQAHLAAAVRRTLRYDDPAKGKTYRLNERLATLMVRPRGLHLPESHLRLDGREIPGALVDFGLFMVHNAAELVRRGSGPYFYLPKLESRHEARLWNDVFLHTQDALGLPPGTIKATVLIETLPAAFEMDEILYELREHSAGLNCGRWDYIFSTIKTLGHDPAWVLPDRSQVTMEQPFLRAYTQLAVRTCHRRGAPAIGGMAAQIPIKGDPAANAAALAKVRNDKRREVEDGHDGTWVAHPALVPVAREVFQARMTGPNQLDRLREDVQVEAADLLDPPTGTRTEEGLRLNVRVGVRYLEAWLGGAGCVPLYHVMEDAATAEISRAQIWQWIRHRARLDDGRPVTPDLVERVLGEELTRIEGEVGAERFRHGRFPEAVRLFLEVATGSELVEFLTLPAYRELNRLHETESEEASIV